MTVQLCTAPHRDNPPGALGGLLLCAGHYRGLVEALTGRPAAEDPTLDCVWGVRHGWHVAIHDSAAAAFNAAAMAKLLAEGLPDMAPYQIKVPPQVVCGDGEAWYSPRDYRPGGLTRDWAALALRDKTLRTGDPAAHVTGAAEAPLPIDDRLADLRSQILHDLDWWVREHAERLNVQPTFGGSVHQHVAWLARYTDWSAAQPFAGEYTAVLLELRARARRAVDLPAPRRTDVGPCVEYADGRKCTGRLFTIARDPGDPTPVVIQCDTCPAAYDSTRWERLGKRLKRAA